MAVVEETHVLLARRAPRRPLHGGRAGRAGRRRARTSGAACTPSGSRRRPARSGRPARGAGADARAGARADPLRPHARLAVHVLPRRRVPDGVRPRGQPRTGLHAQLCGDAHLSNFGVVRGARPAARLQRQRLRRDAPGPVRVGREAPRRELRGRRPRPRASTRQRGRRSTSQRCAPTASAMQRFAADARPRPLVREARRRRAGRRVGASRPREGAEAVRDATSRRRSRRTA